MISEQRLEELDNCFGHESDDPDTQEWRDDLTEEEQQIVDQWDGQYDQALYNAAQKIIAADQKRQQRRQEER